MSVLDAINCGDVVEGDRSSGSVRLGGDRRSDPVGDQRQASQTVPEAVHPRNRQLAHNVSVCCVVQELERQFRNLERVRVGVVVEPGQQLLHNFDLLVGSHLKSALEKMKTRDISTLVRACRIRNSSLVDIQMTGVRLLQSHM